MKLFKNSFLLFAVAFGIVSAFAFKPMPPLAQQWGVASEDATYYYIAEEINGETLGTHYSCDDVPVAQQPNFTCTISTATGVNPDAQGRISKSLGATSLQVEIDAKDFTDLDPLQ